MQPLFRILSLIPGGFVVQGVDRTEDSVVVEAQSEARAVTCPICGFLSRRIHSRYIRHVSDLPCSGRRVQLHVMTRRFVCDTPHCRRRIFAERFGDGVLPERSRRTTRLECIVHHLGLALGGRPAASFAKRLMLPVSNDTLLRVVRRRCRPRTEPLTVVGIDDWAFRRNHRYATIVCDLERRRIVTLLPDREIPTVEAWLRNHPEIGILSRDRGGGYGEAATKALPHAIQVADRWHLMENASAAFLDAVRKSMRLIRSAIGATVINPELLTCAERLQYEGFLRWEEANAAILALAKDGIPIKQIVRRTGHSRKLVRQIIRGERTDIFRTRQCSIDAQLPFDYAPTIERYLKPYFAGKTIDSITATDICKYRIWRREYWVTGPGSTINTIEYQRGGPQLEPRQCQIPQSTVAEDSKWRERGPARHFQACGYTGLDGRGPNAKSRPSEANTKR